MNARLITCYTWEELKKKILALRIITPSNCWEYQGNLDPNGYGRVMFFKETWMVHRLSFKFFRESEYKWDMQINHKCNNARCFNPEHLYSGTQRDNVIDTVLANNHRNSIKTHCHRGHEFTIENTYMETNGSRRCLICKRKRERNRKSQKTVLSQELPSVLQGLKQIPGGEAQTLHRILQEEEDDPSSELRL